jgi:hypothetical protein
MSLYVSTDDGRPGEPKNGQRGVAVIQAEPSPGRSIHRVPDEPADQEVVGDDKFVPILVAATAPFGLPTASLVTNDRDQGAV